MRLLLSGMIIGLSTVIFTVGAQAQTFTNYDLFTGPLNPDLWNGSDQNTNFGVVSNTETQRAVVQPDPLVPNRFLQLMLRTGHPGTGSDAGVAGEGRQNLRAVRDDILNGNPSVIGMRTKIVITAVTTPGCPTSNDPNLLANQSRSRAQVIGFFFNDGSSTGPGDGTGDILVGINVEQRSAEGKLIVAFMTRCDDATCGAFTTLKAVNFTRRWALNVAVPVTVVWDRDNDQFDFTAGVPGTAGFEARTLTYGDLAVSDAQPPAILFYNLRISNIVANCSTPIRSLATARFDFLRLATEPGVFP